MSWSAITGVFSIGTGFIIRYKRILASVERTRLRASVDALVTETAERAAFRATLMEEITVIRGMIKECETDRDILRTRLNAAEGQIVILQASNEITEKWVAFFRDGIGGKPGVVSDHPPE